MSIPDDIPASLEALAADIRAGRIETKAVVVVVALEDRPSVRAYGNNVGAVKAAGLLSLGAQTLLTDGCGQ